MSRQPSRPRGTYGVSRNPQNTQGYVKSLVDTSIKNGGKMIGEKFAGRCHLPVLPKSQHEPVENELLPNN